MKVPLRSTACLVLAAFLVFLSTIAFGAPCLERCPDDGPEGRCLPACAACPCSPHPAPPSPVAGISPPERPHQTIPLLVLAVPGVPEPGDIFHVPKPLLA